MKKLFKFKVRSQQRRGFFKGVIAICLISSMLLSLIAISSFNFALASDDSEPMIPLTDMGNSTYYGYEGGLYPNDSNTMPISHLLDGIALSEQVVPRDVDGQPSALGKIVLLSIGMSIAMQEFDEFMQLSANDFSLLIRL